MFKDLVLPITGTAGDANALDAAIALAGFSGAHLAVLEMVNLPMPTPDPWGLTPDVTGGLYAKLRDQAQANASDLRTRLGKETVAAEVRITESMFVEPPQTAALHARHADMSVMAGGCDDAKAETVIHGFFSALLLESGRPVLVIPWRYRIELPPRHVVVAWKPRRESARALHDALPLLQVARTVDVVVVDPDDGELGYGEQPGADVAVHLARHGLEVNVVALKRHPSESVATTLLRHAAASNAQLLVAGGYGHSRLREWALGGTTRELLHALHLPVLFSH